MLDELGLKGIYKSQIDLVDSDMKDIVLTSEVVKLIGSEFQTKYSNNSRLKLTFEHFGKELKSEFVIVEETDELCLESFNRYLKKLSSLF